MKSQTMIAATLMLGGAAQLAHAGAITCSLNPAVTSPSTVVVPANGVFDADDFSFDNKDTPTAAQQAAGTGATPSNSLRITKRIDASSALIFEMAANGASFQSVTCTVNGAGSASAAAPAVRLTATMSNVTLIAYKATKNQDESPKETVTFSYSNIHVTYSN